MFVGQNCILLFSGTFNPIDYFAPQKQPRTRQRALVSLVEDAQQAVMLGKACTQGHTLPEMRGAQSHQEIPVDCRQIS